MIYKLKFKIEALKEWEKLDSTIKQQFKKKIKQRLTTPHIPSARLNGLENCYKIKLKSSGFRLVYQVFDKILVITVIAVGKRNRNRVYKKASTRV